MRKSIINESFTDVVYHFCTFDAAFFIVKFDSFFLTNVMDAVRERKFNNGKAYYMSFGRHFNSNMGYVAYRNTDKLLNADYMNVRLVVDGRVLSTRYKGVQVNNVGSEEDIVTNRQQEDRLISDKPQVPDAHKYIKEIHIYDPRIGNANLVNKSDGKPPKLITQLRQRILYMMQKSGYEGKIFVFNDINAFNNLSVVDNVQGAIENNLITDPILIKNLAVSPSIETESSQLPWGDKQLNTAGRVYALLICEDPINADSVEKSFYSDNDVWNSKVPIIKERAMEALNVIENDYSQLHTIFGSFLAGNLKLNFGGDYKPFYQYIVRPIYEYMNRKGIEQFNHLQAYKKLLFCKNHNIPYTPRLDLSYIPDLKRYANEAINNFLKSKNLIFESEEGNLFSDEDFEDSKKKIKALIFDFDFTLVDSTPFAEVKKYAIVHRDFSVLMDRIPQTMVYRGIVNLMNQLHKRGIKIFVVTNNKQSVAQSTLAYHNVYYDAIRGSQGRQMPKNRRMLSLLYKFGIKPYEALSVGDLPSDAQESNAAGIEFIGASWGNDKVNGISNPLDLLSIIDEYEQQN